MRGRRPTKEQRELMKILGTTSLNQLETSLAWIRKETGADLRHHKPDIWLEGPELQLFENKLLVLKEHWPKATGLEASALDHLLEFRRVTFVTRNLVLRGICSRSRETDEAILATDLCINGLKSRALKRADPKQLQTELKQASRNRFAAERAERTNLEKARVHNEAFAQYYDRLGELAFELFLQKLQLSGALRSLGYRRKTPPWSALLIKRVKKSLTAVDAERIDDFTEEIFTKYATFTKLHLKRVFLSLLEGERQKDIASALGLSEPAIARYKKEIDQKIGTQKTLPSKSRRDKKAVIDDSNELSETESVMSTSRLVKELFFKNLNPSRFQDPWTDTTLRENFKSLSQEDANEAWDSMGQLVGIYDSLKKAKLKRLFLVLLEGVEVEEIAAFFSVTVKTIKKYIQELDQTIKELAPSTGWGARSVNQEASDIKSGATFQIGDFVFHPTHGLARFGGDARIYDRKKQKNVDCSRIVCPDRVLLIPGLVLQDLRF